jgi:hypothetical protein
VPQKQNPRGLFLEYFFARDAWDYARNVIPLPFMLREKSDKQIETTLVESLLDRAKLLNIDQMELERRITTRIRQVASWKPEVLKPQSTSVERKKKARRRESNLNKHIVKDGLSSFLRSHMEMLQKQIHDIPGGVEKATLGLETLVESGVWSGSDEVYDAMVLLREKISRHQVAVEVEFWKRQREGTRQEGLARLNNIFWSSPHGRFVEAGVSRYCLKESFEIGGFESAFQDFEKEVSSALLETQMGAETRAVAYDLCSISRSRELTIRVRPSIKVALQQIASRQKAGFWSESWHHLGVDKEKASVATTARASLAILKLSSSESMRNKAVTAVEWLLEQQNVNGSWSVDYVDNSKLVHESDLHITLAVMEAVGRSRLSGTAHSLESAKRWVLEQQKPLGFWQIDGLDFASASVLVLETLQYLELSRPLAKDVYLAASAGLLKSSLLLSLEDNATSYRLAILAAHLGIESLLYSILQNKNVTSIWDRQDKNQTIGMSAALTAFQEWLKKAKKLRPDEIIHYRNSVERLAHLRDEVVHKATEITVGECRNLVGECLKFAAEYSLVVYGYDFLD